MPDIIQHPLLPQARKMLSAAGKVVADLETINTMAKYVDRAGAEATDAVFIVADNLKSRVDTNLHDVVTLATQLTELNY